MTVLVFPAGIEASRRFARRERQAGERVVGASSVSRGAEVADYDGWRSLPFIHEPGFAAALSQLIAAEGIRSIYTPHAPTFHVLQGLATEGRLAASLRGGGPQREQTDRALRRLADGRELLATAERFAPSGGRLTEAFVGAVVEQANEIYGECSDEKATALCAIGAHAPRGDVVEIGSFFGKSAYLLDRVSTRFGLGLTIAIDPWDMAASVQRDSPEAVQALSTTWDWDLVFHDFLGTMQALSSGRFNYMRSPSAAAWAAYRGGGPVTSPEFGASQAAGAISILHIDGNHDEAAVRQDFQLWSEALKPGAWVIFDDYEWSQGNGPRVVAEEAIAAYGPRVTRRFQAGGALFLQVDGRAERTA